MGKFSRPALAAGIALCGVGGVMAMTNPTPEDYAVYATETLTGYLDTQLCQNLLSELGDLSELGSFLGLQCETLLQTNQKVLPQMIGDNTQRYNLGVASWYRTTLALPTFLNVPAYHIDTIGAFGQFFTFQVRQTSQR
jgi:hypothetical protein